MLAFDIGDLGDAGEHHGGSQFLGDVRIDTFDARRAARYEPPQRRTSDRNDCGTERERLEYIDAATDATVEDDWHAPLHYIGGLRQQRNRCRHAIDLPAAMVGDPDRRCANAERLADVFGSDDALDDDRQA